MYSHHIKDMVLALQKAGLITKDQNKEATKAISEYWKDKIALTWSVDDVIGLNDNKLTREQAIGILDNILSHHDASIGVNWDVIQCHIDMYNAGDR